jgi:signal peptidase
MFIGSFPQEHKFDNLLAIQIMPARVIYYSYFTVLLFIFPFTVFNFLITTTKILPGAKSFVVVSGSMEPLIPTGSIIYTLKKPQYNVGDVVAFSNNKHTISHRITGLRIIGKDVYYSTKGDANKVEDEDLVPLQNIYGKATTVVPVIGRIIMLYKNPLARILGIAAPILLFLLAFKFSEE